MLRTILVPLDGSDASRSVLVPLRRLLATDAPEPTSEAAAPRKTSRLRLDPTQEGPTAVLLQVVAGEGSRAEREFGAARVQLEQVRQELELSGLRASARTGQGDAVEQILDVARAVGADLIAMGTHGRTGAARLLSGSVAEGVLRRADVPLLLVNPHTLRSVGTATPMRRLLVPIDGTPSAEATIALAGGIALRGPAEVVLARIVPAGAQGDAEALRALQGPLDAAQDTLTARGVQSVRRVLAFGEAGDGLLELIERERVDLVVMATHGRRGLVRALLGSVAEHVVRRAIVPVLVHRVPQEPA